MIRESQNEQTESHDEYDDEEDYVYQRKKPKTKRLACGK